MSHRRVRIVILCEDLQHEAFIRRFLKGMGWNTRELRVEKSPKARGAATQWVIGRFPHELQVYRQRKARAASTLITMIDADVKGLSERINEFEHECESKKIPFRGPDEAVVIAIPKRNIETWIHYLNGEIVNEEREYPKLGKERNCQPAVNTLVEMCKRTAIVPDVLNSLSAACGEYNNRIKS